MTVPWWLGFATWKPCPPLSCSSATPTTLLASVLRSSILHPAYQEDLNSPNPSVPIQSLLHLCQSSGPPLAFLNLRPKPPAPPPPDMFLSPVPHLPTQVLPQIIDILFTYRQIHRYKYILVLPLFFFYTITCRHTLPCIFHLNNISYRRFHIYT